MAKVVCESCNTSFLFSVVKDLQSCPVCGKSLWDGQNENTDNDNVIHNEELSFGEGIELGENDSFDEDKIDFWWYELSEPGSMGESSRGLTYITCTNCKHLSATAYPISQVGEYVLLDPRAYAKCSNCKKELKNHILSKRPTDWVDPRKREMWTKDYENIPKCPICSSTKIHKISMTNKAASALAFGVLASGHVSKTYKCDICGAKF